jgi:hypothetical protein
MWYELASVPALLMLMLLITARAARRFEARERKLGRWDQYGPLEETESPADALAPPGAPYAPGFRADTRNMEERLEVTGQWHGKVLRRRESGHKP